jgi:rare lipoprotein A
VFARWLLILIVGGAFLLEGCATTTPTKTALAKPKKKKKKKRPGVTPIDEPMFADGFDETDLESDEEQDLTAVIMAEGVASYYHDVLAGRRTANGEVYNPDSQTCAHRTLKFGTIVVIEDLDTGRTTRCRINDRGPFVGGRILDMSKRVARDLGVLNRGLARVRIRIVKPDAS